MTSARRWLVGMLVLGATQVSCSGSDTHSWSSAGTSSGGAHQSSGGSSSGGSNSSGANSGGTSSSAAGSSSAQTPAEKCDTFIVTWCTKAIGCLVTVGTLPADQETAGVSTCETTADSGLHCSSVVSVDSSYDQCISQTNAMACTSWQVPVSEVSTVKPPAACTGIIHTQ